MVRMLRWRRVNQPTRYMGFPSLYFQYFVASTDFKVVDF